MSDAGSVNPKELEKCEAKVRKAQEDYKSLVDKYTMARDDFEKKMTAATKQFQDIETAHLTQLRAFVETYCQLIDNNLNQLGRVRSDPATHVLLLMSFLCFYSCP